MTLVRQPVARMHFCKLHVADRRVDVGIEPAHDLRDGGGRSTKQRAATDACLVLEGLSPRSKPWPHDGPVFGPVWVSSQGINREAPGQQKRKTPVESTIWGFLGKAWEGLEWRYMWSIITCPKPEQLTWVAPSIRRAKS